jgi:hypothetical protein
MRLTVSILLAILTLFGGKGIYHKGWTDFNKNGLKDVYEDPSAPIEDRVEDLLRQMTLEEKSCQLATLYGCGRVLPDPLPVEGWKQEVWSQGIANIDEQLNGVGKAYREHYDLIYPFPNHVKALHGNPEMVRGADQARHSRGVLERGHTRTEPYQCNSSPGSDRHRKHLEPGPGPRSRADRRV